MCLESGQTERADRAPIRLIFRRYRDWPGSCHAARMEQIRGAMLQPAFDEMNGLGQGVREPYAALAEWLGTLRVDDLKRKRAEAEVLFRRTGITFNVYGDEDAAERLIPFDIIPRIISAAEWRRLTAGIEQRVRALNAFMYDIYHRQEILKAGRIPPELIIQNSAFVPEMIGVDPPLGIYSHIIGIDIVRTGENDFYVLEDNTRTPSGVSYMLENRETMMHMFPDLFAKNHVAPVEVYPEKLLQTLESVAPEGLDRDPVIAVLTPGHLQQRLFRALLPRRPDGRRAGRGPGPRRPGRRPAHEDDAGADAGRRHLPAHRRLLPRSARLRSELAARRARHLRRLPRRQGHDRQRAGRRHRRRQGDLQLHSRDHRVLHGPAAHPEERADLQLPPAPTA